MLKFRRLLLKFPLQLELALLFESLLFKELLPGLLLSNSLSSSLLFLFNAPSFLFLLPLEPGGLSYMEEVSEFDLKRFEKVGPEAREHLVLLLQMLRHQVLVEDHCQIFTYSVASHAPLDQEHGLLSHHDELKECIHAVADPALNLDDLRDNVLEDPLREVAPQALLNFNRGLLLAVLQHDAMMQFVKHVTVAFEHLLGVELFHLKNPGPEE